MSILITWLLLANLCILQVHSKVIIVDDISYGIDTCCVTGRCHCGSPTLALQYLDNNSVIYITSNQLH